MGKSKPLRNLRVSCPGRNVTPASAPVSKATPSYPIILSFTDRLAGKNLPVNSNDTTGTWDVQLQVPEWASRVLEVSNFVTGHVEGRSRSKQVYKSTLSAEPVLSASASPKHGPALASPKRGPVPRAPAKTCVNRQVKRKFPRLLCEK